MSKSIPNLAELERLLAKLMDDLLADDERTRLETMLSESAAARRHYFWYLDLHAELAARLDQSGIAQPPHLLIPPSPRHQVTKSPRRQLTRSSLAWSILAASLVFAAYFVGISWDMLDRSRHAPRAVAQLQGDDGSNAVNEEADGMGTMPATSPVATILGSENTQWSGRREAGLPPAIRQSEELKITSGLVELELKQGVKLLIEGPAEWTIDGNNNATLKQGKLVAKVPHQAIGFTIETPTAKIVDLGTEFAVAVAERGTTDVHVLRGEVDFLANTSAARSAPARPRRLVAGEAARVDAGSAEVATAAFSPEKFAAMKPVRAKPRGQVIALDLGKSAVASQSSTFEGVPGLKPQPSTAIDGDLATCSHTGREDTNPWWQVDLGGPRELAAVAIQNRLDCCAGRLRDIEVLILAEDGTTVVYRTPPLNRKNLDWGTAEFMRGPSQLTADLAQPDGSPIRGRYVRIQRTTEPTAEMVRAEHQVLSLAEVQLFEVPPLQENAEQD